MKFSISQIFFKPFEGTFFALVKMRQWGEKFENDGYWDRRGKILKRWLLRHGVKNS